MSWSHLIINYSSWVYGSWVSGALQDHWTMEYWSQWPTNTVQLLAISENHIHIYSKYICILQIHEIVLNSIKSVNVFDWPIIHNMMHPVKLVLKIYGKITPPLLAYKQYETILSFKVVPFCKIDSNFIQTFWKYRAKLLDFWKYHSDKLTKSWIIKMR